jgi:hypothetical protein
MSGPAKTVSVYRHAVRLYPRSFRDEYGPDLVALFAEQLRDEPTWRVLTRGAVDLAITVPTRHLEAHVNRATTPLVPTLFGVLALSSLIVGLVVGHPAVLLICIAVGGTAACLGLLSAHRTRAPAEPRSATAHWWKVLVSGAGLMAALIIITTATGELPDGGWMVAMLTGLTAILLMSTGAVLGVAHLAGRPARRLST